MWSHFGSTLAAVFLASLVEFVEALTIVLAVGTVRGWRAALVGSAAAVAVLVLLVLLLGPLLSFFPLNALELVVGVLLLLFGMRWLRKAILRAAGVIAFHDEVRVYATEAANLRASRSVASMRLDPVAFVTAFNGVLLEGLEVVFIVIAVGATAGALIPASLAALGAAALVVGLGFVLHRPFARLPENTLKFFVGVMLSAYGIFLTGEGFGFRWPKSDLSLIGLAGLLLIAALFGVQLARREGPDTITARAP